VVVTTDTLTAAWGMPAAGSFGLEGDAKSSRVAKLVDAVKGLNVLNVSAGWAHVAYIVNTDGAVDAAAAETKLASFPTLVAPSGGSGGGGGGGGKGGAKRGSSAVADTKGSGAAGSKKKGRK